VSALEEKIASLFLSTVRHICDERERVAAAENDVGWLRYIEIAFKLVQLKLEGFMALLYRRTSFDPVVVY
jgi:hypothetical protein